MSAAGGRTSLILWAIGPAFLGVAAWLALASPKADLPRGEVRLVPTEQITPGPWRKPLADATNAKVGGVAHACSECHKLFTPSPTEKRALMQHKEIVLNHGINARCFNCHDGANRDKLVLHDGTLVDFDDTPRLCSQCHGTVYRDWQRGVHGKTTGSWDAASGLQHRLTCNECHNPHAPAYALFTPLPGPNTMRMGDQSRHEDSQSRHEPLRKWSHPAGETRDTTTPAHPAPAEKPGSKEHGS